MVYRLTVQVWVDAAQIKYIKTVWTTKTRKNPVSPSKYLNNAPVIPIPVPNHVLSCIPAGRIALGHCVYYNWCYQEIKDYLFLPLVWPRAERLGITPDQ